MGVAQRHVNMHTNPNALLNWGTEDLMQNLASFDRSSEFI